MPEAKLCGRSIFLDFSQKCMSPHEYKVNRRVGLFWVVQGVVGGCRGFSSLICVQSAFSSKLPREGARATCSKASYLGGLFNSKLAMLLPNKF